MGSHKVESSESVTIFQYGCTQALAECCGAVPPECDQLLNNTEQNSVAPNRRIHGKTQGASQRTLVALSFDLQMRRFPLFSTNSIRNAFSSNKI